MLNQAKTAIDRPTVWRRVFHLAAGSLLPVAGIFLAWPVIVVLSLMLAAVSLGLDLVRLRMPSLNRQFLRVLAPLLKSDEGQKVTGASYMLIATVAAFLAFDQMVAVLALLFLSVGDPAAALVGSRTPGIRIFDKSPVGTLAFIVSSVLVVLILVGGGAVQYHWGFMVGAVLAAVVELAPVPLDDNLTVPLLSGAVMQLLVVGL